MDFGEEITEARLLERLRKREDNFVERKVIGQKDKVLRVAVSFANSAPVGMPCVIYFGVNNDGTLEGKDFNTDNFKKISIDFLRRPTRVFLISRRLFR